MKRQQLNQEHTAKLGIITSMIIYGTIGLFVRFIPMPSAVISMIRGMVGVPFLLVVLALKRSRISMQAIKENFVRLFMLGVMLALNWIFLFEAYRYTSIATAVLCYYFAPIFIVVVSPFVFKEKMTVKKVVCVALALVGMVFVSGVAANGIPAFSEMKGIVLGIGAAILYAAIVVNNKKLHGISAYDRTITQLAVSALVLIPYNLLVGNFTDLSFTPMTVILLLIVGIVHTGLSYFLYFGSMEKLPAQTIAIMSYIDPVVAILLSAFVLKEQLDVFGVIGAVLILGSAMVSETSFGKKKISK